MKISQRLSFCAREVKREGGVRGEGTAAHMNSCVFDR